MENNPRSCLIHPGEYPRIRHTGIRFSSRLGCLLTRCEYGDIVRSQSRSDREIVTKEVGQKIESRIRLKTHFVWDWFEESDIR